MNAVRSINPPRLRLLQEACAQWAHLPSRTLARKLYTEHIAAWPTFEAAYVAVRRQRGNQGKDSREKCRSTYYRPNQPTGFKWVFPKSSAEAWDPFVLDAERTLVLSDLHIPFHDPAAIHAVLRDADKWKPDAVLINGDLCDFFSISRFDKSPTASSLKREIDHTRQFLGWLRQKFPRARILYKYGNHDEWFSRYLWRKAPELFQLEQMQLEQILRQPTKTTPALDGIEFITDQRKIQMGHLDILHGHELGKGSIAPPVNPARGFFLKTLECTLAGHLHRTSQHAERTSKGKNVVCWSTGCLCGLWPDYAKINKWDHSAARIDLKGRDFKVTPIRVIDGQLI